MANLVNSFANWPFLNEPLYRWGLFFLALSFMAWGWNGVLSFMK